MKFDIQEHMKAIEKKERDARRKEYRQGVGLILVIISALITVMVISYIVNLPTT